MDSGVRLPEFKCRLHHSYSEEPQISYLHSLIPGFIIYEVKVTIAHTSQSGYESK